MKLERRFDWNDRTSIYKRVNEDTTERAPQGMVRFEAVRATDGNIFQGAAFETTVASMCDHDFWKLEANPKKPEKSIIVAAKLPLEESYAQSEKVSSSDSIPRIRKVKGNYVEESAERSRHES